MLPNDVVSIFFLKKFSFSFLYLPLISKIMLSTLFGNDFKKKLGHLAALLATSCPKIPWTPIYTLDFKGPPPAPFQKIK
jgi:hypothetical protein